MGFFSRTKQLEKKTSATFITYSQFQGRQISNTFEQERFTREGYLQCVIVFRCVNLIADQGATIQYELFRGKELVENHPILDLLNNPNPMESKMEFLEKTFSYQLITGNAFVEAAFPGASPDVNLGPPQFLYSLRPDRFRVVPGRNFIPAEYLFDNHGSKVSFTVDLLGRSNINHVKFFNPINEWVGLSPIVAARFSIDQFNFIGEWNKNLLQNGASPSGIFKITGMNNLTEEQKQKFDKDLREQQQGARNSGGIMILDGETEWQQLGLSPKDMDYLNSKKTSAHDIALAYGVPMDLINTEQSKFDNMSAASEQLWTDAIVPLIERWIDSLNRWLVPRYGEGLRLEWNRRDIPALLGKQTRRMEALEKISYLTTNEKRKMVGMEELVGGDDLLVQFGKVPISQVGVEIDMTEEEKTRMVGYLVKDGFELDMANSMVTNMTK